MRKRGEPGFRNLNPKDKSYDVHWKNLTTGESGQANDCIDFRSTFSVQITPSSIQCRPINSCSFLRRRTARAFASTRTAELARVADLSFAMCRIYWALYRMRLTILTLKPPRKGRGMAWPGEVSRGMRLGSSVLVAARARIKRVYLCYLEFIVLLHGHLCKA